MRQHVSGHESAANASVDDVEGMAKSLIEVEDLDWRAIDDWLGQRRGVMTVLRGR
ncbi:MAG: hypothetical protein V3S26_04720 [Acidimicrobiia bacterium]|jgi:hypothetical protein